MKSLGRFRFRDAIPNYAPVWLTDRGNGVASIFNVGFRILWAIAASFDAALEVALQGIQASWPGVGTMTALPLAGRTRDIVMGETETPAAYAARLVTWLEQHAITGPAGTALQLHYYLPGQPMVRVVDRSGNWVTVDTTGVVTYAQLGGSSWNWDSTSNPERVGFWSELWIIIYGTVPGQLCYAVRPGTEGGLTGDDGEGWGMLIPHVSADNVRRLIADWKGAHSRIRCVIFTGNAAQFNPSTPLVGTWPDGTWGQWGLRGSDPYVRSNRDPSCRFMEPN